MNISLTTKEYLKVKTLAELEHISKQIFDNILKSSPDLNHTELAWHLGFMSFVRLSKAYYEVEMEPDIYASKMMSFSEEADAYFGKLWKPNNE